MSHDVVFNFLPPDDVTIGSDFDVDLVAKNTSNEKRTITFRLTTKMTFYTGIAVQDLDNVHDQIILKGNSGRFTIRKMLPKSLFLLAFKIDFPHCGEFHGKPNCTPIHQLRYIRAIF